MSSDARRPDHTGGASSRPLVIELAGTPGAGKTTLAAEIVGQLDGAGVQATTIVGAARPQAARTLPGRAVARLAPGGLRDPLLWQVFYAYGTVNAAGFASARPTLSGRILRHQLSRPIPWSMKRHTLFWFFQLAGRRRFLTSMMRDGEALVIDDGFLHRSVALNASPSERPDDGSIGAYVDLLPRPDLVIRPVADRDVCLRRIRDRGVWPHSRHLTDTELEHYVANAEHVIDVAVERARSKGWNVVEIDNGGRELAEVGSETGDAVRPLLRDDPEPRALAIEPR